MSFSRDTRCRSICDELGEVGPFFQPGVRRCPVDRTATCASQRLQGTSAAADTSPMGESHIARRTPAVAFAVAASVVVLAMLVLPAASWAAAAPARPSPTQPAKQRAAAPTTMRVYVPIERPKMMEAPAASAPVAAPKASHAQQMVETTAHAVVSVPMMNVAGTPIPLWWMLLGLLAIPFAKLWQRWTARMFV